MRVLELRVSAPQRDRHTLCPGLQIGRSSLHASAYGLTVAGDLRDP